MAGRSSRPARQMALGGVMAALAVGVMALGGLIPMATFCCPALACLALVPVLEECGGRIAWAWFGAVAVLSCLLCPDREAAVLFLFLGYYPILRRAFARLRLRGLRILGKALFFNAAAALAYVVLIFVLGLESVEAELRQTTPVLLILTLALANLTFFLLDLLLAKVDRIWQLKRRK